jgi:excisionase family DNA binding protein
VKPGGNHAGAPVRVVVVTPDELREIVRVAVAEAMREHRPTEAEWLDVHGAADLTGLHPKTIQRKARLGELPCHRAGRLLRFRRGDLEAYLAGKAVAR